MEKFSTLLFGHLSPKADNFGLILMFLSFENYIARSYGKPQLGPTKASKNGWTKG